MIDDTKVKIALGTSVYNSEITQKTVSVKRLFKVLSEPKLRAKKDGDYFVFASFKDNTRTAANVKKYYGATIDLDNAGITLKEIKNVFKKWRMCIYTTHSHMAKGKGKRYRIVIPYSAPVDKETHVNVSLYLMHMMDMDLVGDDLVSTKALSRPMYLPAAPKDRIDQFKFYDNKGKTLFNPKGKIELPGDVQWRLMQDKLEPHQRVDVTEEVDEGGRNDRIARIAGTLIADGHPFQHILNMCIDINAARFSPPMRDVEVSRTVKSVWDAHSRNNNDSDWSFEQIMERIKTDTTNGANTEHYCKIIASSILKKKTNAAEKRRLARAMRKIDRRRDLAEIMDMCTPASAEERKAKGNEAKVKEAEEFKTSDTETVKLLKEEYDKFFHIAPDNTLHNVQSNMSFKIEGFNNANTHICQDTGMYNQTPFRILQHLGIIKGADSVRYHPGRDSYWVAEDSMRCVNTYKKPNISPMFGKIKMLMKHFRYLFSDPFERDVMLDFIAYHIQRPGTKFLWTPIIKGHKGIGKGIIANEIITPLLGINNVLHMNNSAPLGSNFNSWQQNSQLVIIHELFLSHKLTVKQTVTENLKSFITEPYLFVEKKGKDPIQVENITNMMAFTNHEDSLYITADERRFCMIRSEVMPKDHNYYGRLIGWLRENIAEMYYYFKHREIKTISPYELPKTSYTRELMDASRDWAGVLVDSAMEEKNGLFKTELFFTWGAICEAIKAAAIRERAETQVLEDIGNAGSAAGRMVRQAIMDKGFRTLKVGSNDRFSINGKQQKIWLSPKAIKRKAFAWPVSKIRNGASKTDNRVTSMEAEYQ